MECDEDQHSVQCTAHCNEGFEMVTKAVERYVCRLDEGVWKPTWPDCSSASPATRIRLEALLWFAGSHLCTDSKIFYLLERNLKKALNDEASSQKLLTCFVWQFIVFEIIFPILLGFDWKYTTQDGRAMQPGRMSCWPDFITVPWWVFEAINHLLHIQKCLLTLLISPENSSWKGSKTNILPRRKRSVFLHKKLLRDYAKLALLAFSFEGENSNSWSYLSQVIPSLKNVHETSIFNPLFEKSTMLVHPQVTQGGFWKLIGCKRSCSKCSSGCARRPTMENMTPTTSHTLPCKMQASTA